MQVKEIIVITIALVTIDSWLLLSEDNPTSREVVR